MNDFVRELNQRLDALRELLSRGQRSRTHAPSLASPAQGTYGSSGERISRTVAGSGTDTSSWTVAASSSAVRRAENSKRHGFR